MNFLFSSTNSFSSCMIFNGLHTYINIKMIPHLFYFFKYKNEDTRQSQIAYNKPEVKNMLNSNCNRRIDCSALVIFASVIIGIVAGIFRAIALITITPAFLWVLFGITVVYLGILLLTSSLCCAERKPCCDRLILVLIGILGTILTSVILLGITFAATSIIGAIITGLLLFFFSLAIGGTACLIKCKYNCD